MAVLCGACGAEIASEDINVSTDVAFCRACSKAMALSSLAHGEPGQDVDLSKPPRGASYRDDGTRLVVSATMRSVPGWVITAFASFWTVFCTAGFIVAVFLDEDPDPMIPWMAIPFGLATAVLWGVALMFTIGRQEVRLHGTEGVVFTGVGPVGWSRRFDVSKVRQVRERDTGWRDDNSGRRLMAIVLELEDRQIRFGATLSEMRRRFVLGALRKVLGK